MAVESFWNSGLWQVIALGLVAGCIPGIFNTINSMAGGIGHPEITTAAGSILSLTFGFFSFLAPVVVNTIGPRVSLVIGGLGYPMYMATLVLAGKEDVLKPPQLIIVAGFVMGLGAALLWTAFGALFPLYATPQNTQKYFGIFWGIFNGVTVVTDLIKFGTTINSTSDDGASDGTLFAFMGLQVAGCFVVLSMQSPTKVVRSDGTQVAAPEAGKPVLEEIKGMGRLLGDGRALALIPLYLYTNWCYVYQFNIFNGQLFDTTTQWLNNSCYWGAQTVAPLLMSLYLDSDRPAKRKAYVSFIGVTVFVAATWIAGAVAHFHYHLGGYKGGPLPSDFHEISFKEAGTYIAPLLLYTCWGACDAIVQGWSYWIYAQFTNEMEELSRFSGWYKLWNSLGNAFAGFLYAQPFGTMGEGYVVVPRTAQLWINMVLFAVSVPCSLYCCSTVKGTAQTATEEFLAKEAA